MNYQKKLEEIISNIKEGEVPRLLLHACCAPCSSYCIEYLASYFEITIYYYNPNIDTKEEFEKRVHEITKFTSEFKTKYPVKCVIETYDNSEFEEIAKGYENDKEGSTRCFRCYEQRLRKSAEYAKNNNFDYFTTTLSISPYKNSKKLNEIGEKLESELGIKYLYADFKKNNGYKRSIELSKEYKLYRQDYCGCKYSKIERDLREQKKQEQVNKEETTVPEVKENKVFDLYNNKYNTDKIIKRKKDKDPNMFKFSDIKKGDLSKPTFLKMLFSLIKLCLLLFIIIVGVYYIVRFVEIKVETNRTVPTEEEQANISEIYVYGNHMNLKGNLITDKENITDVTLLMKGSSNLTEYDLEYEINNNNINFYISDKLNTGFLLDNLIIDNYLMFIKVKTGDDKNYYYALDNTSGYDETIYYSITDENGLSKKFVIEDENKYDTMYINITKSKDESYDIVIDPGHGGKDVGACYNNACETDYTLKLSEMLKKDLENNGFKVTLTRDEDVFLSQYGDEGRVTNAGNSNAKMLISIHLNSSDVTMNGFELYTSNNIDYSFAREVISNLDKVSDFTYSYNPFKKQENGIYTRTFAKKDIDNINADADEKDYEPFDVSLDTNYYFMIRETGGYMTGAYVDGRDDTDANPHVLSNVGIESYILELGYITSKSDLDYIDNNKDEFIKAVSDAITDNFNK